jgi:hypothetical protein
MPDQRKPIRENCYFIINDYRHFTSWTGLIASALLFCASVYFAAFFLAIYFNKANAVLMMENHYG